MNIELLEKIKKEILEEPKRVNMGTWLEGKPFGFELKGRNVPECGTVGCIAGWACVLGGNVKDLIMGIDCNIAGTYLLGLTDRQSFHLFYIGEWPLDLKLEIAQVRPQTAKYAQVVAARIDRFIKTKGEE